MSDILEKLKPIVDKTISKLLNVKFRHDPIAGKYSIVTSLLSSAYKRHGTIIEEAIVEALRNYTDDNIFGDLYIKWFVFEQVNGEESKPPKRYSILHIECYGTSIYSSLYHKNELYPEILVIKQPNLNHGNGLDFFHHKIRKI
jgi:hypothetical protein